MADPIPQGHPTALAQQQRVDAAYNGYTKAAGLLSDLVTKTHGGDEDKAKLDPKFTGFARSKQEAWTAWQREASRHGKMLIGMD